ncbi:MAG: transporter substrate-binding domain-containing protein [Agathobaculum sp.]|jgi:polar amino acid transport system substrate-binding protein|uniref:transporter substrate-binding domain-containing protein n=1 Tax=Agathobaculum sp. TaxID=2048138 RepID=UPI003D8C7BAD
MKTKKLLALLLAGAMSLSMLAGCGSKDDGAQTDASADSGNSADAGDTADDAAQSDVEYVKNKGTLIVGITDFAPMDYKEEGSDEWIGFDADMAKAFAESLGVKAEFIEINWDNKVMELSTKAIDAVWNGMTLTDEVTGSMNCSQPYALNAQVVVVPADKAEQYQDAESIKELSFAVESGSAGQAAAEALGLNFTPVQTQAIALMETDSGASDACIIDLLMAGAMIGEGTSYPKLTHTVNLNEATGEGSEEYGVGFRQDSDLTATFNEFYKSAYEAGTVEELATTYGVQEAIVKPQ